MHGNLAQAAQLARYVDQIKPDAVIQVGDFGYCYTKRFLEYMQRVNAPIYFLHGNHDNVPMIVNNIRPDGSCFVDNMFYLPQGKTWIWEDVNFAAFGGAYSIDRRTRKFGKSWWLEAETLSEDVVKGTVDQSTDIMISHDVPFGVEVVEEFESRNLSELSDTIRFESGLFRKGLRECFDNLQPELVVHGHWHYDYDSTLNGSRVLGLGTEGDVWIKMLEIDNGEWELIV